MKKIIKKQPDPKKLMQSSESKKKAAADQEYLGKAQIKNKVKSGQAGTSKYKENFGEPYPVGKERLKIAKDMRLSAKLDSLQAVRVANKMSKKKK
jgi:hypothetical protein